MSKKPPFLEVEDIVFSKSNSSSLLILANFLSLLKAICNVSNVFRET